MQIRSKTRVAAHGEVFTNPREVNAMLDLVKQETERIESRFLEPACGNGNFLEEILRRKLAAVARRAGTRKNEWLFLAFISVSSVYGVDILEDNVAECRARLFGTVEAEFCSRFAEALPSDFAESLNFLLLHNILWGDALTMSRCGGENRGEPLVFSLWAAIGLGRKIKRHDFSFSDLVNRKNADLLASTVAQCNEHGEAVSFPRALKEFPPMHFLKICATDS